MIWTNTTRRTMLAVALGGLMMVSHAALAQHGGGPGGGMGGPQMGGGMGRPAREMGGAGMPRGENFIPQRPAKTNGPQLGLPGRWWDDKKNAKMISLRPEQQQRMDALFEENKGSLVTALGNLQREEAKLQGMSPQELQDKGKVFAQIDRVAAARAELEKQNAEILMLIRQQLEPAQLNKLDSEIANLR